MSSDAVTAERVHRDLKEMIKVGRFGSGRPLLLQTLADEFGVSISPVRDALNRLVGERIVEVQPGGGFASAGLPPETVLRLYSWHADIARVILKAMPTDQHLPAPPEFIIRGDASARQVADATFELFAAMAANSPNPEHLAAINGVGERLHLVRICEGALTRGGDELLQLWNAISLEPNSTSRLALDRYNRRRIAHVEKLSTRVYSVVHWKNL